MLTGLLLGILHYVLKPAPDEKLLQQYAQHMANSTEWQGRIAPDFELKTTRGERFQLSENVGKKIIVLNFFATWCGPCREEMPAMEKLYQEYKPKNFIVLAVAVKDRKQDAIDFVKELKITYPIALDPDAKVGGEYGAWGLPATYLIGPKGEGLARGWGPAEWYAPAARKLIQDLTDGKR